MTGGPGRFAEANNLSATEGLLLRLAEPATRLKWQLLVFPQGQGSYVQPSMADTEAGLVGLLNLFMYEMETIHRMPQNDIPFRKEIAIYLLFNVVCFLIVCFNI